jgi:hypothetical protein
VRIFRRPADPTEAVLRRLSKRLRWFRPSLADAPTPSDQLAHFVQHRLCPAIDRGDTAPVIATLAIVEEALTAPGPTQALDDTLDHALTVNLIEVLSNWTSWPETPPEVVTAIEAAMGPATRERWHRVHRQAAVVTDWIRDGGDPDRDSGDPAVHRQVENDDLRFLIRSSKQYVDETLAIGIADRLRHELATGQGM